MRSTQVHDRHGALMDNAVFDLAGLISALTVPAFIRSLALSHTFVYFAIAIPAVKVYSNSVLAVLNCRKSLPHPGDATANSELGQVELSVLPLGRRADGSDSARRIGVGQGTEPSHIVIDICAASGDDSKGFGGRYAERRELKFTARLDGAEINEHMV
ncbi:hypothetical protein LXA43DRAFT_1066377 [Ganoderma leucocontextum]|nr:hypothetical protein LXA43DRAFT_1066377 [Ganoderma leucocontextum]